VRRSIEVVIGCTALAILADGKIERKRGRSEPERMAEMDHLCGFVACAGLLPVSLDGRLGLTLAIALLLAACAARVAPTADAAQCLARLDGTGVRYERVDITAAEPAACAVEAPVRVTLAAVAWNQPGVVSCAFAMRLEDFTRTVIEPAARARFGEGVHRIRHLGTYSCRRENGGNGRWSQHARGSAIDIAGFELASGTVVLVASDWRGGGAKSAFLRDIARAACARFSAVLTPDSDSEHRDHIHLDAGPYRICGA
jgi:hypothetical protein